METQKSSGDGELDHSPPRKLDTALQALERTADVYAQELRKLRALNQAIPLKQCLHMNDGSSGGATALSLCPAFVQNLLQEKDMLCEQLKQNKMRCAELQRQLEQEHAEKLEAQMCLNVLNETVRAALKGEEFLLERNWHVVSEQKALSSKLDEVSKTRLPAFKTQIKDLEAACNSMKQEELVHVLYNKVCMRGLWVFVEIVLFCHAMLWCVLRTLKETYGFAPT